LSVAPIVKESVPEPFRLPIFVTPFELVKLSTVMSCACIPSEILVENGKDIS
jgi:hypothetical protein